MEKKGFDVRHRWQSLGMVIGHRRPPMTVGGHGFPAVAAQTRGEMGSGVG